MATGHHYESPVVWKNTVERLSHRWKTIFVLVNLFYVTVIAGLGVRTLHWEDTVEPPSFQKTDLQEYRTKEVIYSILKHKGISLNQGLEIAQVTIDQSRSLGIPISLILAVMKKESLFVPYALSSENAMGLMQIHPVTWNDYVDKLRLNVSANAAFDPVTNVIVGTHVIKDLHDVYKREALAEPELWEAVLSAYYAGRTSLKRTGVEPAHRQYVADVRRFQVEFEKEFSAKD